MVELYKHFYRTIRWNAFESTSYQILLAGHQIALYSVMPASFYGFIGSLFSIIYLIITITNFGFDISLSPFFTLITSNKHFFKKILSIQLIPEYCILVFIFLCMILLKVFFGFLSTGQYYISTSMFMALGGIIFFESAKKTLRMILQLAFMAHKTALIEIATIVSYTGIVWLGYGAGYPINLPLIFIPMLFTSAISTCILAFFVYDYYCTLPDLVGDNKVSSAIQLRMVKNRFYNFLNQASHMLFSSNFLVPFFGLIFGLHKAGILKLISSISHCITVLLQKVFGISSALLLSHLKDASLEVKQQAFLHINNRLNQVLYGIILFLAVNYTTLAKLNAYAETSLTLSTAYLFLLISFSENFFIAYEKFYITQEKTDLLVLFNLVVMSLLGIVIYNTHHFSQLGILLIIIAIRILAFSCISLLSFYRWNIKPALKIQPVYCMISLSISLIFYMLAKI